MTGPNEITPLQKAAASSEEERDLLRVRRPSKGQLGQFTLAIALAGQMAGVFPQSHASGAAFAMGAVIALGRECVYRRR